MRFLAGLRTKSWRLVPILNFKQNSMLYAFFSYLFLVKIKVKKEIIRISKLGVTFQTSCISLSLSLSLPLSLSLSLYIYIYIYIYTYMYVCIYVHRYACICVSVYIYLHLSTRRMRHKVNLKQTLTSLKSKFSFS